MFLSFDADVMPDVRLIGRVAYKEPWIHFARSTNEYILFILKSGELFISEGEAKYALKKGDTLLLQPGVVHSGYQPSCCDYYYIHFRHAKLTEIAEKTESEIIKEMVEKRRLSLTGDFLSEAPPTDSLAYFPKHHHLLNDAEIMYTLKEAIIEYYNRYENYKRLVSCKLTDIMIHLCREFATSAIESRQDHYSKTFVKARNILNYINLNYHQKISSDGIEQLFDSNYDYLNRVFHKISGYSIFNYLNMVRINKAKELIETTQVKFSEIGYLVGIDDQYYFSKLFKKYTGLTPTQYLEKNH